MQPLEMHVLHEAVAAFHATNDRAAAAPLGSPEYDDAIDELRRRRAECEPLGLDPMVSWRQPAQLRLTPRKVFRRPGERERARRSNAQ